MSVEQRLQALENKMNNEITRRSKAAKPATAPAEEAGPESGCCWQVIKITQYIIGFVLSIYSLFITGYGLVSGYSKSSPCSDAQHAYAALAGKECVDGPFHPALVIVFAFLLITILAFCEGTQIALMLLEKVNARDLPDSIFCASRVRRTHQLAQNNTERYLLGRQIFVTGIVFLMAKMIGMKYLFATAVEAELGWFGNRTLVMVFVYTGFAGSLIVLAFGQLLPQLIVTTTPLLQYQLFPTYEIIWLQLFCERLGVADMAVILRKFTRWAYKLEDEPFGVGSGVEFKVNADLDEEEDNEPLPCCVSFWMEVPYWQLVIKAIIGFAVFCVSIWLILDNVLSGASDFTQVITDPTTGKPVVNPDLAYPGWTPIEGGGDINVWVQLLIFLPFSNIVMGFLEGSQIAILALEKAPAKTIKRTFRGAYFGHKLTQQRDNVRRYLLGRQFLVVFVDFIAAHTMGLGGLGILVPVSQLWPQILGASNPAWFMSTWGSKGVLLLALMMEFTGLCHFSWGLFTVFFVIRNLVTEGDEKADVGSVGQAVDIEGVGAGGEQVEDIDELRRIVVEQQEKIEALERTIAGRS